MTAATTAFLRVTTARARVYCFQTRTHTLTLTHTDEQTQRNCVTTSAASHDRTFTPFHTAGRNDQRREDVVFLPDDPETPRALAAADRAVYLVHRDDLQRLCLRL